MKNIEMIPSVETFIEWVERYDCGIKLTEEEANVLLGYVLCNEYGLFLDGKDMINLVDTVRLENGIAAKGFKKLAERVSVWNAAELQESEAVGPYREQILMAQKVIGNILDRMSHSYLC